MEADNKCVLLNLGEFVIKQWKTHAALFNHPHDVEIGVLDLCFIS